jgi:hypothetical protein
MAFDITRLSEDELLELNQRIVERLRFIRSAKNLTRLAQFSVGMIVEFTTDDGRTISGRVARLNQKTAMVVTAAGRWRVSPSLLRPAAVENEPGGPASRVLAMPPETRPVPLTIPDREAASAPSELVGRSHHEHDDGFIGDSEITRVPVTRAKSFGDSVGSPTPSSSARPIIELHAAIKAVVTTTM